MNKKVKIQELFKCETPYLKKLFESYVYPWEIIPCIAPYIAELIKNGLEGFEEIEKDIWIGKNVKIFSTSTIEAPAIIGEGTEIRPGAFIRGNVITGSDCVIGNSTELKNCILLNKVQVPHYNYVGDSILGNHAHMGAGAVCSNLKSDGKSVVVRADAQYQTNLRKLGGILADGADVGCGCVVNPGTVIGKNTSVYPLTSLRGVYPGDSIVKNQTTVVKREIR